MLNFKTHGKQTVTYVYLCALYWLVNKMFRLEVVESIWSTDIKLKKKPTKTSKNKLENRMGKIKVFFIQLAKAFKMNWFCFMIGLNNN